MFFLRQIIVRIYAYEHSVTGIIIISIIDTHLCYMRLEVLMGNERDLVEFESLSCLPLQQHVALRIMTIKLLY